MFCHVCGVSEARDVVTDSPGEGIFFWGGGGSMRTLIEDFLARCWKP